jgi:hypothetical protein
MFNRIIRYRLKQLEARQAAHFLLRIEAAVIVLKLVWLLVIAAGIFWLYAYLSESKLVLTAEMNDAMQISGEVQHVGPVGGWFGSLLGFFLAFVAGALFVEPLQKNLRQIRNLKQTKYARLSERMEDIIKDNGAPTKQDEVLMREWIGIKMPVAVEQNFEVLASFMPVLQKNLKS